MKEVNTVAAENLSKSEIIDSAILNNISGGNNGSSKCGGGSGWTETCGTEHGDWCGTWGEPGQP
ncbi:hypothetical protein L2755_07770 [Shewanella abyssi]|uniref:hypothetical protein n=1 Tax=Shewanella abyssi TaxID=311789 RepID=UPI00200D21BE|nr:hypothetical protein [Shewanella abyssi]MCL1049514.1 hypothetical protein [Shewanella abyssi]